VTSCSRNGVATSHRCELIDSNNARISITRSTVLCDAKNREAIATRPTSPTTCCASPRAAALEAGTAPTRRHRAGVRIGEQDLLVGRGGHLCALARDLRAAVAFRLANPQATAEAKPSVLPPACALAAVMPPEPPIDRDRPSAMMRLPAPSTKSAEGTPPPGIVSDEPGVN